MCALMLLFLRGFWAIQPVTSDQLCRLLPWFQRQFTAMIRRFPR